MRILIVGLASLLPLLAQNPRGSEFFVFKTAGGYRTEVNGRVIVATSANKPAIREQLLQLSGNVEIRTDGVILLADEVDYHIDSGEIEPRGNVRVKLASQ